MTVFLNIIVPLMVTVLAYIVLAALKLPTRLSEDKIRFEDYVERTDEQFDEHQERIEKLEAAVLSLRLHRAADTGKVNGGTI